MTVLPQVVRFPDPEAAARAYLIQVDELGVPVATQVPATRPARFVRVVLAGGYRRDLVTYIARLAFEYWAPTETAAADLCRIGSPYVLAWADTDEVRKVDDVSTVNSPDPDSRTPRYVHTVEVHFRPERGTE